jgi:glucose-6-phosphate dehydrogenase assembly protein OpcA
MIITLTHTDTSEIANALLKARSRLGSASGLVLTLVVAAEQRSYAKAYAAAQTAAREHPCRLVLVVKTTGKTDRLDADIHLAEDVPGEVIVLRLSGEVREHADSVVLPMLLPDSPVVVWWPGNAPESPSDDILGQLADRRVTDAASSPDPIKALQVRAIHHSPGDTDLTWTRLTLWRALLTAALDQFPMRILSATVLAPRNNAPADLMAAWLESRLTVTVHRMGSAGPGITSVLLETPGGHIVIAREDGKTASYAIPGQPRRTVALKRRDINELLTEELRRLDADDVYAAALAALLTREGRALPKPEPVRKRKEAGAIAAARVAKTGARAGSRKAARVQEALGRQDPPLPAAHGHGHAHVADVS